MSSRNTGHEPRPAAALAEVRDGVPVAVSVADWTAGYEAGWSAGYRAARTTLDDAARALAALQPSRALAIGEARASAGRRTDEPDHGDPAAMAAYRARIYASWGLPPPTEPDEADVTSAEVDSRRTA